MKLIKQLLMIGLLGLLSPYTNATVFGINYHPKTGDDINKVVAAYKNNGFKHVRIDVWKDANSLAIIQAFKNNSIDVTAIVHTTWAGNIYNNGLTNPATYCPGVGGKTSAQYTQSYSEATLIVNALKQYVNVFELENEVSLWAATSPTFTATSAYNVTNLPVNPYSQNQCMQTMSDVLMAISDAIKTNGTNSSGVVPRVILGTASNEGILAFLNYMKSRSVVFDIVGYHAYHPASDPSLVSNSWYDGGNGGGEIGQLKTLGKPIHYNEFNCGEIYNANYDNTNGSTSMNACISNIQTRFAQVMTEKASIEIIDFYELADEPENSGAEARFGLYFTKVQPNNFSSPKSILGAITNLISDDDNYITLPNGAVIPF